MRAHNEYAILVDEVHSIPVNDQVATNSSNLLIPQRPREIGSSLEKRISVLEKSISIPLGRLSLRCDKVWQKGTPQRSEDSGYLFEFWLSIVPRRLLSQKASTVTGMLKSIPRPSLASLNIQLRPIVSSTSAIREACWNGDTVTMEQLFRSKRASPHDVDEYGEDLLTVRAYHLCSTIHTDSCISSH